MVLKLKRCDQEFSKPGKPSQELGTIQKICDGETTEVDENNSEQERSKEKLTKFQDRLVLKLNKL